MEKEENYSFNLVELIGLLFKWRKTIIYTCIAGIAVSVLVSYLVTEKYESNMIFYPTVGNSFSSSYLKENVGEKSDPLEFGSESQVEEMLQILNSDMMKGSIVKRFNLMNHYKIDDNDFYKYKKLNNLLKNNIKFRRTDFTSIEVKVLDEDKEMAAKIVDGIGELIDSLKTSIQKQVALQALAVVEQQYFQKINEIKIIDDSLNALGQLGIYNPQEQARVLTDLMAKGIGNSNNILQQQMLLAKYSNAYETLSRKKYLEQEKETNLREKYMQAKVDAEAQITHKFIVSKSGVSLYKAYPVRWLMVIIGTLSVLAMSILIIIFYEKIYLIYRRNNNAAIG